MGVPVRLTRRQSSSTVLTRRSDRLRANLLSKQFVLEVDLEHLIAFNEELANRVRETPAECLPLVRSGRSHRKSR